MNKPSSFSIRKSTIEDVPAITKVYNWAIVNTDATFDTEEKSVDMQKEWFLGHGPNYPILVSVVGEKVVGWGSISEWSDRCAYSGTGEVSFYILPEFHGMGIGSRLMEELLFIGKKNGFRTLISKITTNSTSSLHLHKKYGFEDVGVMKVVGEKFGKILDVKIVQYIYKE